MGIDATFEHFFLSRSLRILTTNAALLNTERGTLSD